MRGHQRFRGGTCSVARPRRPPWLPGDGLLAPRDVEAWTAQLGRALAAVHAAPLEGRDASVLPDDDWLAGYVLKPAPAEHVDGHPDGADVWAALQALWSRVGP